MNNLFAKPKFVYRVVAVIRQPPGIAFVEYVYTRGVSGQGNSFAAVTVGYGGLPGCPAIGLNMLSQLNGSIFSTLVTDPSITGSIYNN